MMSMGLDSTKPWASYQDKVNLLSERDVQIPTAQKELVLTFQGYSYGMENAFALGCESLNSVTCRLNSSAQSLPRLHATCLNIGSILGRAGIAALFFRLS